jgi:hypothetical protein
MGMVKGPPPRFDLNGIHDEDARNPYVEHNPTYFYRCLISCCAIANVALTEHEQEIIYDEVKRFEQKYRELLFGAYAAHP